LRRYSERPGMSDTAAIEAAVIDVLKEVSRRPIEPTPASDLVADLGFDSLQVLEAISELEGRFDVTIDTNQAAGIRTVAEVAARIAGLMRAR
jgi:acyl carrier protein